MGFLNEDTGMEENKLGLELCISNFRPKVLFRYGFWISMACPSFLIFCYTQFFVKYTHQFQKNNCDSVERVNKEDKTREFFPFPQPLKLTECKKKSLI